MKGQSFISVITPLIVLIFIISFWAWWSCVIGNPTNNSCNGYLGLWIAVMIVGGLLGVFKFR